MFQMSTIAAPLPMTSPASPGERAHSWKPLLKALAVLVGYSLALAVACVAVDVRQLNTQGPDAQASGGMYAFGDALLFGAVFGGAALLPTGLGLYFLRPVRTFWTLLAIAALALAATGPISAAAYELLRHLDSAATFLQVCAGVVVLRMLGAPLLAATFLLSACLAPTRFSRWSLVGATALEGLAAGCAIATWFIVPRLR
jgi:hypothetical protein